MPGCWRPWRSALKDAGLPSLEWYDVLWALEQARSSGCACTRWRRSCCWTRFNATRLVDRLEREGLVSRQRSKEDRRGARGSAHRQGPGQLRAKMWPVYRHAIATISSTAT